MTADRRAAVERLAANWPPPPLRATTLQQVIEMLAEAMFELDERLKRLEERFAEGRTLAPIVFQEAHRLADEGNAATAIASIGAFVDGLLRSDDDA